MHGISRRSWIRLPLALGLAGLPPEVLEALQHAHRAAEPGREEPLRAFDTKTAAEVESLAGAIIPTDTTPGAVEAGVIHFIDRALSTFDSDKRESFLQGLASLQKTRIAMFPQSQSLKDLTPAQRITLLESIEKTPFFESLRTYTIVGFFASPDWGGNRGKVGWKLIGLDDTGRFQPPFGYYDAEAAKGSR